MNQGVNMTQSDLLGIPETSGLTGTPEATLRWYRSVGIGPKSFKVGRRVRYHKSDVLEWLAAQENKSARGGVR
jgi:predicted DNA-binding transcriptional regulator AlpA